jgi:DNA polymerase III subunit epsilon
MNRQIVLDTETTGLRVEEGHRIIEIGCVEMIDRKLTGKHFHHYVNPEREVEAGAQAVHGITTEFLRDKPGFVNVANELMDFISGAELIIHNAPFDVSFLNQELTLASQRIKNITEACHVIDTLQIARRLHVGQRNSLDALCKRYGVDNSKREWHGALLDAHLLAQVYLAMTGGQGSFFDSLHEDQSIDNKTTNNISTVAAETYSLIQLKANEQELLEHEEYLKKMKKVSQCLWLDDGSC